MEDNLQYLSLNKADNLQEVAQITFKNYWDKKASGRANHWSPDGRFLIREFDTHKTAISLERDISGMMMID